MTLPWAIGARIPSTICALCWLALGCAEPEPEGAPVRDTRIARGLITATLERYIEAGSDEPFERFRIAALFPSHKTSDSEIADGLLRGRVPEPDLALDTCSAPAPELHEPESIASSRSTAVDLLDVGDMSVAFGASRRSLNTRTFPDLLRVIVGVTYAGDESTGITYRPGETYSIKATGSDSVSRFEAVLEAPNDLGDLKVNGLMPGDQVPFVQRGEVVDVTWDGERLGDEVVITLGWTSMGAPWSLACRARDDGAFSIPAEITTALPDPLTSSDEAMTVARVRQTAFRARGLSMGTFAFVVSTVCPVKF